jgi:hypothetical protein
MGAATIVRKVLMIERSVGPAVAAGLNMLAYTGERRWMLQQGTHYSAAELWEGETRHPQR